MADLGSGLIADLLTSGEKPVVPNFVPIDTKTSIGQAVDANIANFDSISNLASKTNQFNTQQIMQMLSQVSPGWQALQKKAGDLASQELSGQLPIDVQNQIQQSSAARALAGGFGQGGMKEALTARDLGLTSLNLTNQGFNHAQQWLQSTRSLAPNLFNAASMFINPAQQIGVNQYNTEGQFQHDWMVNQIKAAPDPFLAAVGETIRASGNTIDSWISGIMGSGGTGSPGAGMGSFGSFGGGGGSFSGFGGGGPSYNGGGYGADVGVKSGGGGGGSGMMSMIAGII